MAERVRVLVRQSGYVVAVVVVAVVVVATLVAVASPTLVRCGRYSLAIRTGDTSSQATGVRLIGFYRLGHRQTSIVHIFVHCRLGGRAHAHCQRRMRKANLSVCGLECNVDAHEVTVVALQTTPVLTTAPALPCVCVCGQRCLSRARSVSVCVSHNTNSNKCVSVGYINGNGDGNGNSTTKPAHTRLRLRTQWRSRRVQIVTIALAQCCARRQAKGLHAHRHTPANRYGIDLMLLCVRARSLQQSCDISIDTNRFVGVAHTHQQTLTTSCFCAHTHSL